ncbi:hypothetical protein M011DRAFT_477402 [Sporormia fimetaria CBS 119925]|uniref:Uncharacterized protein n=1 Tax=Sporormia fimetaria CBS 119925 TaxID=1340428 RepID=A0A6A6VC84_9PLEO|nr:hypothetical protein M011DRAFT_477402 [Sporormia fimetaria CBS 119925]
MPPKSKNDRNKPPLKDSKKTDANTDAQRRDASDQIQGQGNGRSSTDNKRGLVAMGFTSGREGDRSAPKDLSDAEDYTSIAGEVSGRAANAEGSPKPNTFEPKPLPTDIKPKEDNSTQLGSTLEPGGNAKGNTSRVASTERKTGSRSTSRSTNQSRDSDRAERSASEKRAQRKSYMQPTAAANRRAGLEVPEDKRKRQSVYGKPTGGADQRPRKNSPLNVHQKLPRAGSAGSNHGEIEGSPRRIPHDEESRGRDHKRSETPDDRLTGSLGGESRSRSRGRSVTPREAKPQEAEPREAQPQDVETAVQEKHSYNLSPDELEEMLDAQIVLEEENAKLRDDKTRLEKENAKLSDGLLRLQKQREKDKIDAAKRPLKDAKRILELEEELESKCKEIQKLGDKLKLLPHFPGDQLLAMFENRDENEELIAAKKDAEQAKLAVQKTRQDLANAIHRIEANDHYASAMRGLLEDVVALGKVDMNSENNIARSDVLLSEQLVHEPDEVSMLRIAFSKILEAQENKALGVQDHVSTANAIKRLTRDLEDVEELVEKSIKKTVTRSGPLLPKGQDEPREVAVLRTYITDILDLLHQEVLSRESKLREQEETHSHQIIELEQRFYSVKTREQEAWRLYKDMSKKADHCKKEHQDLQSRTTEPDGPERQWEIDGLKSRLDRETAGHSLTRTERDRYKSKAEEWRQKLRDAEERFEATEQELKKQISDLNRQKLDILEGHNTHLQGFSEDSPSETEDMKREIERLQQEITRLRTKRDKEIADFHRVREAMEHTGLPRYEPASGNVRKGRKMPRFESPRETEWRQTQLDMRKDEQAEKRRQVRAFEEGIEALRRQKLSWRYPPDAETWDEYTGMHLRQRWITVC